MTTVALRTPIPRIPYGLNVALLFVALLLVAGCASAKRVSPAEPSRASRPSDGTPSGEQVAPPAHSARFADEIARFAEWDRKNSFPRDAILFVGSSSIRMWPTHEAFPNWPVINRGFGGSTIAEVNHYFKQVVEPYHARVIVFYAGDNDIAAGRTPEQVRDDFATFVKLVRAAGLKTPVVYISIKPSESRWQHWPSMQRANALIRELCETTSGLTYVDVTAPLLDSAGKPRAEMYLDDRLHLSGVGYAEWKKVLEPALETSKR